MKKKTAIVNNIGHELSCYQEKLPLSEYLVHQQCVYLGLHPPGMLRVDPCTSCSTRHALAHGGPLSVLA